MNPSRFLIVDDSPLFRLRLSQIFVASDRLHVVGLAGNGREALKLIAERKPNVILLDLEMPEMDGFSVLRWTMKHAPVPVVVCSGHSDRENVFKALEAGAIDFITKPQLRYAIRSVEFSDYLRERVEAAADARAIGPVLHHPRRTVPEAARETAKRLSAKARPEVVVICGSTGSPTAMPAILAQLPKIFRVPIIAAIHMPQGFTRSYAERLSRTLHLNVVEARHGDRLSGNRIYIAPGGHHTRIKRNEQNDCVVELTAPRPQDFYTPSANELFESAAGIFGENVLALVLSGMGDDGLKGSTLLKAAGATLIAESKTSSVIWGMPRAVVEAGLADAELDQSAIAALLPLLCGA